MNLVIQLTKKIIPIEIVKEIPLALALANNPSAKLMEITTIITMISTH